MKFLRLFLVTSLLAGLCNFVTFVPQASAAAGEIDSAVTLNGTNQAAWVSDTNTLDVANAITMEAWVNPSSITCASLCIIMNKETSYEIAIYNGTYQHAIAGTSTGSWTFQDTGIKAVANEWHHVAFTRAANTYTTLFYLDGVLQATDSNVDGAGTSTIANSALPFTVGARTSDGSTFSSWFPGQIDEVRVWGVVRSASDIQSDMDSWGPNNTSGLQMYYDFNDVSGSPGTVINRVSGANSGTTLTFKNAPSTADIKTIDTSTFPGYSLISFPRSYLTSGGGWVSPTNVNSIEALVVGGGGGGGFGNNGGGGGAGGVLATNTAISISPSTSYSIIVGQGGLGSPHAVSGGLPYRYGYDGDTSTAFGAVAVGGGGGGGNGRTTGNPGGSGGGAAYPSSNQSGGSSIGSIPNSNWTRYGNAASGSNAIPSGGAGAGAGNSGGSIKNGGTGVTIFGLNIAGGGAAWTSGATPDVSTVDYGGGYSPLGASYSCSSRCDALANTGSGGGAGGSGAAGIVVIKYKNYFGASVTISVGAKKTTKTAGASAITATTTSTGTVTFYANGRIINGCKNLAVSGTTATCNWRPMTHGQVTLTATYTSNDPLYSGSAVAPAYVTTVSKRTTSR